MSNKFFSFLIKIAYIFSGCTTSKISSEVICFEVLIWCLPKQSIKKASVVSVSAANTTMATIRVALTQSKAPLWLMKIIAGTIPHITVTGIQVFFLKRMTLGYLTPD